MKKILSVLSTVGLAVSLAACSPAADNTRTNEYRPMNVAPNNPTDTIMGVDRYQRYNNVGDGRYDTYRNGVIKDQTNYRPGAMYDTRDRILRSQGMTDAGVTNNGQRMYTTQNNAYRNSVYKPQTYANGVRTSSTQPLIGYTHLGDNQTINDVYVDRQMLCSAVANVANQVPGVKRTTVLATDNQIFVGCDTSGLSPAAAQQALENVQKSCANISPRYYNVYTTNNPNCIAKVQQNQAQLGTKTDQEFEQMIGYKPKTAHFLSTK
jgi:hypothetical protein